MRKLTLIVALLMGAALVPKIPAADNATGGKIRVLLVTGGHAFEKPQFFKVFEDNPAITFEAVEHPNPKDKNAPPTDPVYEKLKPDAVKAYDVIVLYDMWQKITDEAKADFVAMLKQGKGLVVLHHAIANYQDWPEYHKIFGARYYLKPTMVDGVEKPRSQWKHDVKFNVHIADREHPIARGLKDFEIHDETYKGYDIRPDVKPLLTTEEPLSSPTIGWTKTYEKARVAYLQLGHDHLAYENPNFPKLVAQAIAWAAGK
jgi:type 1 glutamine amidotransferase